MPAISRVAIRGRNPRVQYRRFNRREDVRLIGLPDPPDVDGDEDVRRPIGALGLDPLEQRVLAALDPVDLDAGLLGEVGVERLIGCVVARGVEIEHLLLRGDAEGNGERQRGGRRAKEMVHDEVPQNG